LRWMFDLRTNCGYPEDAEKGNGRSATQAQRDAKDFRPRTEGKGRGKSEQDVGYPHLRLQAKGAVSEDVTKLPKGDFFVSEFIVFNVAFAKRQKSHSLSG